MSSMVKLSRKNLIEAYIRTQVGDLQSVDDQLKRIESMREVIGWMLVECQMLDSRSCGQRVLWPYGPGCTNQELIPVGQFVSINGMPSGAGAVIAYSVNGEEQELMRPTPEGFVPFAYYDDLLKAIRRAKGFRQNFKPIYYWAPMDFKPVEVQCSVTKLDVNKTQIGQQLTHVVKVYIPGTGRKEHFIAKPDRLDMFFTKQ